MWRLLARGKPRLSCLMAELAYFWRTQNCNAYCSLFRMSKSPVFGQSGIFVASFSVAFVACITIYFFSALFYKIVVPAISNPLRKMYINIVYAAAFDKRAQAETQKNQHKAIVNCVVWPTLKNEDAHAYQAIIYASKNWAVFEFWISHQSDR